MGRASRFSGRFRGAEDAGWAASSYPLGVNDERWATKRERGFWTKWRPLRERMLILACFVVPVSGAVTYVIYGTGALIADLIACAVILLAVWVVASRLGDLGERE
jgi:hypothetical protein